MPAIARNGDLTSEAGYTPGIVTTATGKQFFVNGKEVAVKGDSIVTHIHVTGKPVHPSSTIKEGTGKFTYGGKEIARLGDGLTHPPPIGCSGKISTGSGNFSVG